MRNYLVKTPRLLKALYNKGIWHINEHANSIYLSFDDGPHPELTPYVLDLLKQYQAKATFFCIGKNVQAYPEIFQRILDEGHAVGNHTHNHLNGWRTNNFIYFKNIKTASKLIPSNMFRPPYGRITPSQAIGIQHMFPKMKIIMWDVLSGDFDIQLSPKACYENVIQTAQAGSIVVFHDSDKAKKRLQYALPKFLDFCKEQKWNMKKLNF
ncbi:MAG: polysaccharide deacetylase family protein [Chitinophagaceae bacterium]